MSLACSRRDCNLDRQVNKSKNKKYHTVRTLPKLNGKIEERGEIDTPNTNT
jgi:hypothetical protein